MSLPAVIETRESLPAPRDQQAPPVFLLLQQAIDKGIGVDALEKLQTLYERETSKTFSALRDAVPAHVPQPIAPITAQEDAAPTAVAEKTGG